VALSTAGECGLGVKHCVSCWVLVHSGDSFACMPVLRAGPGCYCWVALHARFCNHFLSANCSSSTLRIDEKSEIYPIDTGGQHGSARVLIGGQKVPAGCQTVG
jgi:hypothetical protein